MVAGPSGGAIFQSTLPAWGATLGSQDVGAVIIDFNPRSPHGERPVKPAALMKPFEFQSTLPAWGATMAQGLVINNADDFNPRSPHGERLTRSTSMVSFL